MQYFASNSVARCKIPRLEVKRLGGDTISNEKLKAQDPFPYNKRGKYRHSMKKV